MPIIPSVSVTYRILAEKMRKVLVNANISKRGAFSSLAMRPWGARS
jgi:hypothetical protein